MAMTETTYQTLLSLACQCFPDYRENLTLNRLGERKEFSTYAPRHLKEFFYLGEKRGDLIGTDEGWYLHLDRLSTLKGLTAEKPQPDSSPALPIKPGPTNSHGQPIRKMRIGGKRRLILLWRHFGAGEQGLGPFRLPNNRELSRITGHEYPEGAGFFILRCWEAGALNLNSHKGTKRDMAFCFDPEVEYADVAQAM